MNAAGTFCAYAVLEELEAARFKPRLVHLDGADRIAASAPRSRAGGLIASGNGRASHGDI